MNDPYSKFVEFLDECETECTDLVLKNYCGVSFKEIWQYVYFSGVNPTTFEIYLERAIRLGYGYFANKHKKVIKIKFSQEYKLQNEATI